MLSLTTVPRQHQPPPTNGPRNGIGRPSLPSIRRRCDAVAIRRTDTLERLKNSLACIDDLLEVASADTSDLVETYAAENDYTRERTALHLRARLEGLVHQVHETAAEVSALSASTRRLRHIENS